MIIKSKSRKTQSFEQLINYLFKGGGNGGNSTPIHFTQNLIGSNQSEYVQELIQNEKLKKRIRKNATRVIHEIISFHPSDSINIRHDTLRRIAHEYMRQRSPSGMFLAVPHMTESHVHIHICGSPWETAGGRSLRFARNEFKEFKSKMEQFQRINFPELKNSAIEHDRKTHSPPDLRKSKPLVSMIIEELRNILTQSNSWSQFIDLSETRGLHVYYRNKKPQGIILEGRKHRFKKLGFDFNLEFEFSRRIYSGRISTKERVNTAQKRGGREV